MRTEAVCGAVVALGLLIGTTGCASDEEKIKEGIENDTFFDAVSAELEEGRELYKSRVAPALYDATNFYDRAVVDIIIRSKGHLKSPIW